MHILPAQSRVMVIAAHPDDEVLGCGGTMARLVAEGHELCIAIFGEGITSRSAQREQADPALLAALQARAQEVAKALGAQKLILHSLPDNRFDTVPLLEVVKLLEKEITRVQPQVIFTHHAGDLNQDHATLHRAVLTATRPAPEQVVRTLFAFEAPSSTEWAFGQFQRTFQPNVFIDIRESLETKIQLMERYEGEARRFPHPRSPEALRAIAQRWGTVAGLPAAEAFELIRDVH